MKTYKLLLGYLDTPERALEAADKARRAGFGGLDLFSPYPVHGFEEALGLKPSWVPSIAKVMLIAGAGLAFLLQAWTSAVDWPINVGGKPLVSWPAFMPVVFEGAVLLAGLATFMSLMHFLRAWPGKRPAVASRRLTVDRFALAIPAADEADCDRIKDFLKGCGIDEIEIREN